MVTQDFERKTKQLIDSLKGICASYGLGNDGNEFKIITQVFLYKFLNDKFAFEIKKLDANIAKADKWEQAIAELSDDDLEMLQLQLSANTARLKSENFISHLFEQQNAPDFAKLFDDTLRDIAISNNDIFSVKTKAAPKSPCLTGSVNSSPTPQSVMLFAGRSLINWLNSALSTSSIKNTTFTLPCLSI